MTCCHGVLCSCRWRINTHWTVCLHLTLCTYYLTALFFVSLQCNAHYFSFCCITHYLSSLPFPQYCKLISWSGGQERLMVQWSSVSFVCFAVPHNIIQWKEKITFAVFLPLATQKYLVTLLVAMPTRFWKLSGLDWANNFIQGQELGISCLLLYKINGQQRRVHSHPSQDDARWYRECDEFRSQSSFCWQVGGVPNPAARQHVAWTTAACFLHWGWLRRPGKFKENSLIACLSCEELMTCVFVGQAKPFLNQRPFLQ